AVKTPLEPGYLPGRSLDEHFALKLPALLDSVYFADGRTRAFAYQEGHLSSDCYLNGSMTCVDCHDPHTQHYRDVNRSPLPGRLLPAVSSSGDARRIAGSGYPVVRRAEAPPGPHHRDHRCR